MILEYLMLGFCGAMAVEILKLYEMMGNIEASKFKAILLSRIYWLMTFLMAIASGFIAWGINSNVESATIWQVIISGVGARTLVTKPIELKVAHSNTELGSEGKITLKDIYG